MVLSGGQGRGGQSTLMLFMEALVSMLSSGVAASPRSALAIAEAIAYLPDHIPVSAHEAVLGALGPTLAQALVAALALPQDVEADTWLRWEQSIRTLTTLHDMDDDDDEMWTSLLELRCATTTCDVVCEL